MTLASAALAIAVANLVIGWLLGMEVALRLRTDFPAMVPETALAIIAGALGVLGVARSWRQPLILVLSLFMLAMVAVGLLRPLLPPLHRPTDAMSGATAISVAILAFGLALKRFGSTTVGLLRVTLKSIGLAVVSVPLIAYVFDVESLLANSLFGAMAVHTALSLLLLLLALQLLDPLLGWVAVLMAPEHGSQMARRLMPFIIFGPILFCWLALLATEHDLLDVNLRLSVLAYGMIVMTAVATLYFAHKVNQAERRTVAAELQLHRSERLRQESELAILKAQKVEALGQLVAGVAHDFNNTLTVILGNLELIGDAKVEDERSLYTAEAIQAAEMAATHTGQLLAYVRKSRLDPLPQALDGLIGPTVVMFRRLRPANIEILTDLDAAAATVTIDGVNFQQALLNLLINARDAMPTGGTIMVTTRVVHIGSPFVGGHRDPHELPEADYVSVSVLDTGAGMTRETLERATEPFYSTKEVGEGSGLGLSVVSGFCRQSGGALQIVSSPGEGAELTMLFPVSDAEPVRPARQLPPREPGRENVADILVVDDEPQVTRVVARQLEQDGHRVRVAQNAEEAQEIMTTGEYPPDLVLTDLIMPGRLQGHELARWIRNAYPRVAVVVMSGYESERQRRLKPWTADLPFLQKPIDRARLRAVVARVVEARGKSG